MTADVTTHRLAAHMLVVVLHVGTGNKDLMLPMLTGAANGLVVVDVQRMRGGLAALARYD